MIQLFAIAILGLTNLALLVGVFFYTKEVTKERSKFINALIARNAPEMRDLELTDKVEPLVVPEMPEMTPLSDLSDKEFDQVVLGDENGG